MTGVQTCALPICLEGYQQKEFDAESGDLVDAEDDFEEDDFSDDDYDDGDDDSFDDDF